MPPKSVIATAAVAVAVLVLIVLALRAWIRAHKRCGYRPCGGDCENCRENCDQHK